MVLVLLLTSMVKAEFNFDTLPEKLTAYYASSIQPIDTLERKLKKNGFQILAITEILKGEIVVTITNRELKSTNSYVATLQLLVNTIRHEIRVQNPSYFGAAYLQERYYYGKFKTTLYALKNVLGEMSEVKESYDLRGLAHFQFMYGLPYLKDTLHIKVKGNPLKKLRDSNHIAYHLNLPNGAILVGHQFKRRTNTFLKTIKEENNAQLLPYESMIQDGRVTILNPKYYLPLSLPFLDLGKFMKIATAPDTIKREISKSYK
jgi:hypothetical protein